MKFKSGTRRRALEYEKDWVQKWKADKTFEKSVENRSKDNSYVFYDGPPFISGSPHHGTLLSSIVKDAIPRYQTMKGKRVERVWGWDCHGLPAERFTEKKLGIHSRQEVIEYGIEKYINATRENMVQTSSEWEDVVDRIGRWVDFKGAYKTMDKDYMESIWWAFKTLYEKGKIYEGEKVLMYCTLDGTPLSKAEVTMDSGAYQDVTDPSVYVKFKIKDDFTIDNWGAETNRGEKQSIGSGRHAEKPVYLLAWTTTPWTLPANTALALNSNLYYAVVEYADEYLILAEDLIAKVFVDEKHQPLNYKIVQSHLLGEHLLKRVKSGYEPLLGVDRGKNAHKVWHAPYVSHEDGTGIVHIAPAYGEEDFELAKEMKIPVVHTIDQNGMFTEGDWQGQNVWEINKQIAKDLHGGGTVWRIDYIRHPYPHCHRCGTKLMYRAHPSWFMDIDGQRQKMLEKNEPINWFPAHVKHGRFEKTVEQAPDWNISRDRFWATAMPVWKTKSGKVKVVGSYAELTELSGVELEDYHRPWIDDVTFEIDGETYTRIDKVMDSWFEAGSMPFAQFHYPFENKEKFEANFPGDFIVEYIGQVRAWFYYMHAMSVALFGENSFKNVIVTGNVAGNDGRKMSKSYGNFTDPNELMDKFSADSLRFLLLSSPLLNGEDFALQDKEVGDVARKLSMIWNMYDFFTLYAEADKWEWDGPLEDPLEDCNNPLDIWIISRLHQLVAEVEKHMDGYNLPDAMSPILPFIDDASNWFVRRSRRRFWKSEDDDDKAMAYRTLHYVLVRLAYVIAPFTPFLAEELYHNLTGDKESIHLKDWLPAGHVDTLVMNDMETVRGYVNEGLSLRARAGLKVRQPLASVTVPGLGEHVDFVSILQDELNVKDVKTGEEVVLDETLTPALKREGLMREVVRYVQAARKNAGLNVDDRIKLSFNTDSSELNKAIYDFRDAIAQEVLQIDVMGTSGDYTHQSNVKIDGFDLMIKLEKV
ncbi:MAG TPA: isoleucine--tRNA ligase [Candidatus Saccharimonas sp.]|nr:isoleucine--tRNA ligase [Candidatus Saccharimonas sp.]